MHHLLLGLWQSTIHRPHYVRPAFRPLNGLRFVASLASIIEPYSTADRLKADGKLGWAAEMAELGQRRRS